MPQANGTYIQDYNAQLAVETQGLIIGQHVCQSPGTRRPHRDQSGGG